MQYVWYAAYGSNLSSMRLSTYLEGGRARGSTRAVAGARDSTPPTDTDTMVVGHQLGFGYESNTWGGGGVAFISAEPVPSASCMMRLHRVTAEQLEDIYSQENRLGKPAAIDTEALERAQAFELMPTLYGQLLHLGRHPDTSEHVITFTSRLAQTPNAPSVAYLKVICEGLADAYGMAKPDVISYLSAAVGMTGWSDSDWDQIFPTTL